MLDYTYTFYPPGIPKTTKVRKLCMLIEDENGNNTVWITPSDTFIYDCIFTEHLHDDATLSMSLHKSRNGTYFKYDTYIDKTEITEEDFLSMLEEE